MIYSFIPAGLLALAGALALFRPTRVLAAYVAGIIACSTGLAIALAGLGLVGAMWLYPYSGEGGDGLGLAMALWFLLGGVAVAHKLTRGRPLF